MIQHTLELKGYVYVKRDDDEDVYLEAELPKEGEYYYPKTESIGAVVADEFAKVAKSFQVSYDDWTRGELLSYQDVFLQYYISDVPLTWDEAQELHVRKMAGMLTTEDRRTGYSEYTITDSWTDVFVGGHDLRAELRSHKGKYAIIRINYKA